jgi:hypothetical protein
MNEWEFQLDQLVAIRISGERGHVMGRSHYSEHTGLQPGYWVHYLGADGSAKGGWFGAHQLEAVA